MGWPSSNMTGVLIRDSDTHIHKRPCEERRWPATSQGTMPANEIDPANTSIVDFQPPETEEESFCCLSHPVRGVCKAVVANYTILPFLNKDTSTATESLDEQSFFFSPGYPEWTFLTRGYVLFFLWRSFYEQWPNGCSAPCSKVYRQTLTAVYMFVPKRCLGR